MNRKETENQKSNNTNLLLTEERQIRQYASGTQQGIKFTQSKSDKHAVLCYTCRTDLAKSDEKQVLTYRAAQ